MPSRNRHALVYRTLNRHALVYRTLAYKLMSTATKYKCDYEILPLVEPCENSKDNVLSDWDWATANHSLEVVTDF